MYEIIIAELIGGIVGIYGLYSLNKILLTNKLVEESAILKGRIAKFRQDYGSFSQKPSDVVANSLGEIGIDGILDELGIDKSILANPLVKGLIKTYAPKIIEGITNKTREQQGNAPPFM
jgi:hypothetical protein